MDGSVIKIDTLITLDKNKKKFNLAKAGNVTGRRTRKGQEAEYRSIDLGDKSCK